MFFKNYTIFLFLTGITLISCSSSKDFPQKYKGEQLHFGQGGGFSGLVNYYALLDDGRLFHRAPRDSTFTYEVTWDNAFVRQMFSNYHTLELDKVVCNEPGNLYYFLQHKSGDGPFHIITWGNPGFRQDENIVTYYNLLYKSTKSKS
jgi:hypothetical protein